MARIRGQVFGNSVFELNFGLALESNKLLSWVGNIADGENELVHRVSSCGRMEL
jgi:hypothetical protein